MYRFRGLLVGLLIALSAGSVSGERVEELVELAIETSDEIADAEEALAKAEEALAFSLGFDASRLSVSSSVRYLPDGASQVSPQASANFSLPLLPQISLSSGISTDFEGVNSSFGLSISPFASGSVTFREREAYDRAALQLAAVTASIQYRIESAVFAVTIADLDLQAAQRSLMLEQSTFESAAEHYRIGDLSWSEYNSAAEALSSAERSLFDAERNMLSARLVLVELIGPELGSVDIEPPTIDEIEATLADRRSDRNEWERLESSGTVGARIDLRTLEAQLSETRIFEPSISLQADSGIPVQSVNASISITLSPDQFHGDERAELAEAIEEASVDLELARLAFDFELDMLGRRIVSAEKLYESSISGYESATLSYHESKLLAQRGAIEASDVEEASISMFRAEIRRYQNAVDLLSVYSDLQEYADLTHRVSALLVDR